MTTCFTLLQRPCISVSDEERIRVDLTSELDASEQITTVVVTETTGLVILTDAKFNPSPYVDVNTGATVGIAKAATVFVTNPTLAPGTYALQFEVRTTIDNRVKNYKAILEMS